MTTLRKYTAWSLTFLLMAVMLLAGCGGGSNAGGSNNAGNDGGAPSLTIKIDHNWGHDHPHHIALVEKFKPMVESQSGGSLEVSIYGNNQLGGEREIFDGINNGTIEMAIAGTVMSSDIPKWAAAGDWPFLIDDFEHAKRVYTGAVGREIADEIEEKSNAKVLGWGASGFRMFSSSEKIESIEDFQGKRIRMPNIPTFVRMGQLLGINVIPLDFTEVFTALEQKVADGQENPISILRSNGWYEVQDYVVESKHVFFANAVLINEPFWDQMTSEQQEIVQNAMDETLEYEWQLIADSYDEDKKFLEEHGMTFITPDDAFMKQLQDKMEPLYEEIYADHDWAAEIVQKIRAESR